MFKDDFLKYLLYEKHFSAHTIRAYSTDLKSFIEFFENDVNNLKPTVISHQTIRAWILSLIEIGNSNRTINRKLSTLKSYFKYLSKHGLIENNPMDRVLSPKTESRLFEFFDSDKLDYLLNKFPFNKDFEGVRDQLIIELFYNTGMRLSELKILKDSNIDTQRILFQVFGKRKKERYIPFSEKLLPLILHYIELRNEKFDRSINGILILTDKGKPIYDKLLYRIVRKYLGYVSSQQKRSPHILRHTFATTLLNNGADLNAVKELLGHANLSATQIYTHNTFEKVKSIYKQAHPRA